MSRNILEWSPLLVKPNKFQVDGERKDKGVVHHVQGEHHQTDLLHHYQNASIQGRQIQCMMDQL